MDIEPSNLRILDDPPFAKALDLVNDVFHRINRVLPEDQKPLTVAPNTLAREAIALMVAHGYSQLPVLSGSAVVLGVFSYRSFASKAAQETLQSLQTDRCAPGDLPVDEFLEEFQFARVSADLPSVFTSMDADNGVLIGTPTRLQGVLSPMDFLLYLYQVASPFVLLSEIELALRSLINTAVTKEQLITCIKNSLSKAYDAASIPTDLTEMTFDNYKTLLNDGRNWELFQPFFGGTRPRVAAKLAEVGSLRNDIFHFKRELEAEDRVTLKAHRDWILMKAQQAEANDNGGSL